MPKDRSLTDIFTDMLVQYKLFVMRSDRLIEEAKQALKEQEKKDETD